MIISVDGGYSDFGDWSECSAECGGGTQSRNRTCTNPAPANGGADCVGDNTETRECNNQECPGKLKKSKRFSRIGRTLERSLRSDNQEKILS